MSNPSETKASRLLKIEVLLLARPEGLTQSDIARKLGVNRSTIGRYLPDLPKHIYIDDLDGNKWKIDRGNYLVNLRFNIHEAMSMHLAIRLLTSHMDKQSPHAAAALRKLGVSLEKLAPQISSHILQAADVMDTAVQRHDPHFIQILEQLTIAWAEKRMVNVWHRHEETNVVSCYKFAPYFITPYAAGHTMHVIGLRQPPNKLRTFTIERIERVDEIKPTETYEIPPDFDPTQLLAKAWGIWYTDEPPQTVQLRFQGARVVKRVQTTQWHQTEKEPVLQADGSLLWEAEVAEPKEMEPWVRGWGANVEVLEPEKLREGVKDHVRRSAINYGITTAVSTTPTARLLQLWGKTSQQNDQYHPALYHMLDVAHVAQQLLSSRATPRWRNVLGHALNTDPATLHEWLPYLIALHDIGKLSTPFQMLNSAQVTRLQRENFGFGRTQPADGSANKLRHTVLGRLFLKPFVQEWPKNLSRAFLDMVSGHHGTYRAEETQDQSDFDRLQEPAEWGALRQHAQELLHSLLCYHWPTTLPDPANISAAIVALNGFCILCDWLGSDENYFTPRPNTPLWEYLPHSRQRAYERVESAGFFQQAISHAPTNFADLFGFAPRPLQSAINHIPEQLLHHPTLTIIEAPTGEGKTEAALALARRIAALRGTDEMYIALPTTATSNAMHGRVQTYLTAQLGLPPELVRLIHGQSFLHKDDLAVNPLANGEKDDRYAEDWFAPKKKALLAPIGVGTIDQAELSTLNVRHNALRLIGLAGKTIILDEVHAYDTYMTTIIKRMLQWLSALGSSVILLSATLPTNRRCELAEAFAGHANHPLDHLHEYPNLLTISTEGFYTPAAPVEVSEINSGKEIALYMVDWGEDDTAVQANWLFEQVRHGGCACWITNTVKRAQELYNALPHGEELQVHLIHGRFSPTQRQQLEAEIMSRYGQPSDQTHRPRRGIVIGTQVLEQSLDLDFDVMATDLAPIDLLLQRAGRLHRHQRPTATRHQHATPRLYLNQTMSNADKAIYSEYILTLTKQALAERAHLHLPADYRPLVEAVYTAAPPRRSDLLYAVWDKLDAQMENLETNAEERLMPEPHPHDIFYLANKQQGFSEEEDSIAWATAQTRWSEQETITLIPLVRTAKGAKLAGVVDSPIVSLDQKAPRESQLTLLRHSIRLSDIALVNAVKAQPRPALFESALLKHTYPLWVVPDPTDETCFVSEASLSKPVRLHPKLGLLI